MSNRVFTQKEAVAAYKVLEKIKDQPMSWKMAYWMTKLRQKLKVQMDFQTECEKKLVEKYGVTPTADGRVKLKSPEEARSFDAEWTEIGEIQLTDLKIKPIVLTEMDALRLSPEDVENLDGFVEFIISDEETPQDDDFKVELEED